MSLDKKTIPADVQVDDKLAAEIGRRISPDGRLSCAEAFAAARAAEASPAAVGGAADAMGIRLGRCQLGLFGYPGRAKGWTSVVAELPVQAGFEDALRSLPPSPSCPEIWNLADASGVSRLQAGYLADRLGLKVGRCPLGAF
ncbi:MAG: hypothetical protein FJY82_10400 [Candidatus Aminicenantes bacterium]|nr:hypothetical protein [Candidatus Aminicenantes bacterium]